MEEEKKDVGTAGASGKETNEQSKPGNQQEQAKQVTLTQEELEKKLQSESDKRVNQALSTARKEWEKEYTEKLAAERKEAERLATLSAEERKKELEEKQRDELKQRERTIARKEMKMEAMNILSEKKLPIKFADMLIGETAEETQSRIKDFEKAFREEVDGEVTKRLKGSTPAKGASGASDSKKVSMNDIIRGRVRRK